MFIAEIPSGSTSKASEVTAFERKLSYVHSREETQERPVSESDRSSEWCIIDVNELSNLLRDIDCPECGETSLTVKLLEEQRKGFAHKLSLNCSKCGELTQAYSSPRTKKAAYAVNDLMVLFFNQLGLGHEAMKKLGAVLGMKTLHLKIFQESETKIIKHVISSADTCLDRAWSTVRDIIQELEDGNETVNVTVSFDGSWQKRGHTSLYGVAAVIEVMTGLVVDYIVLSKYCHACAIRIENDEEFNRWYEGHKSDCCINYHGSSNAMETEAARRLWARSTDFGIQYTGFLGDGDSKAYDAVCAAKPYGEEVTVEKEECVNHAHKRMGTALLNLSKTARLGGRGVGRLTKDKAIRFQHYYRNAITSAQGNVEQMRNNIWATLFHCLSTDDDPHHSRCPPGQSSWCFYQRAIAKDEDPPSHCDNINHSLANEVAQEMVPIYKRMSEPNLLKRLARGKTQNTNECLHSVIWSRCPKTVFIGARKLNGAVASAVASYNEGARHLTEVMSSLDVEGNEVTRMYLERKDARRLAQAQRESSFALKQKRQRRSEAKKRLRLEEETDEGTTYGAGLF